MRLYQKPCARVNSGFEDFGVEKLEFKISHYDYDFELYVENSDRMFEKSNILFDGLNAICYSIERAICRIVRREKDMVSYSRLWHLLLDKKLKRTQLCEKAGISSSTLAKLGKNEVVSIEVLERICDSLGCDIGDVMSFREGDLKKGE